MRARHSSAAVAAPRAEGGERGSGDRPLMLMRTGQ
jgi:hypothetical protein